MNMLKSIFVCSHNRILLSLWLTLLLCTHRLSPYSERWECANEQSICLDASILAKNKIEYLFKIPEIGISLDQMNQENPKSSQIVDSMSLRTVKVILR